MTSHTSGLRKTHSNWSSTWQDKSYQSYFTSCKDHSDLQTGQDEADVKQSNPSGHYFRRPKSEGLIQRNIAVVPQLSTNTDQPSSYSQVAFQESCLPTMPYPYPTASDQIPVTIAPEDTTFFAYSSSADSSSNSSCNSVSSNSFEALATERCDRDYHIYTHPGEPHACSQTSSVNNEYSLTKRKRHSEFARPGSARAIYLEKNRQAASKCRNKQKRQQEELVETARDIERRNKILKAEAKMLQSDIEALMDIIGQHFECPDTRLKVYIQREADRLVGTQRSSNDAGPTEL